MKYYFREHLAGYRRMEAAGSQVLFQAGEHFGNAICVHAESAQTLQEGCHTPEPAA